MAQLHPSIAHIPIPIRMRQLPIDKRGFPVPFFVAMVNGEPDHRLVGTGRVQLALKEHRCWLCGGKLEKLYACVIGPMCAVNRTTSEPPSHKSCALYAVQACPFLTRPHAHRRETGLPENASKPAGEMLMRNPGVALVWMTRKIFPKRDPLGGGVLFTVGEPEEVFWFAEGRPATREEVKHSIVTGLPTLRDMAVSEGERALQLLYDKLDVALRLLPVA